MYYTILLLQLLLYYSLETYFSKLIHVINVSDYSVVLHWYKILLGISGTLNGILALALISLILLGKLEDLN